MSGELRVLLLHPPSPPFMNVGRDYAGGFGTVSVSDRARYGHDDVPVIPFVSLLYVAAILERAGHCVAFLDAQAEGLDLDACCERAAAFAPDAVISVVNLPSMEGDLALLGCLKEAVPGCRVVAIGTVCRALCTHVLGDGVVDVAVTGDPELVVPQLVRALADPDRLAAVPGIALRHDGEVVLGPPAPLLESLDSLPMPAYHLAPMDRYWHHHFGRQTRCAHVVTSRGCPEKCGYYCPYPFGFGTHIRLRSVEAVVEELTVLRRRYDVGGIVFRDMSLTASRPRAVQLFEEMIRRELNLRWLCEVRLNHVDAELLALMRASGCERVHYGLETGAATLLSELGKPGVDLEMAARVVAESKAVGLNVQLHMMLGLPGETWETVRETRRVLRRLRPDSVQAVVLAPYPGTQFREDAMAAGRVRHPHDWARYTGGAPIIVDGDHLKAEEILRARDWLYKTWRRDPLHRRVLRRAKTMLMPGTGSKVPSGSRMTSE